MKGQSILCCMKMCVLILNSELFPSNTLVKMFLFHFSHAGLDVRLLDPPKHVPDSEVLGDYWWHNFPCWEPHAGPESSEEVRLLMIHGTDGSQRERLAPFRLLACS